MGVGLGIVAPRSTAGAIASALLGVGGSGFAGLSWEADRLLILNRHLLPDSLRQLYFYKELFRNWRNRPVTSHGVVRACAIWGVSFSVGFSMGFLIGATTRFATETVVDTIKDLMHDMPQELPE